MITNNKKILRNEGSQCAWYILKHYVLESRDTCHLGAVKKAGERQREKSNNNKHKGVWRGRRL